MRSKVAISALVIAALRSDGDRIGRALERLRGDDHARCKAAAIHRGIL